MAVESRSDLAARHGSIVRITVAHSWFYRSDNPICTRTSYMAPRRMSFRAQRSARMLGEDDSIGLDEMIEYKHSTRMELADLILDDLIPAARRRGGLARRAAAVLDSWDREADADSGGAVRFQAWASELGVGPEIFEIRWDEKNPGVTPDGLRDTRAAIAALEAAAAQVEEQHGALDVFWGDVYRLRYAGKDLPANGGPDTLGVFRVLNFDRDGETYRPRHGDTYVAAIEFSDPVQAKVLLSYGNASQPHSPHRGDQLELFANKELRPAWRTSVEVESNLESSETLQFRSPQR